MSDLLDLAERVEAIVGKLTEAQRVIIARMGDVERAASAIGAVSSDSTRRLEDINRCGELVSRHYRAGTNRYRLAPLGLAVRDRLLARATITKDRS